MRENNCYTPIFSHFLTEKNIFLVIWRSFEKSRVKSFGAAMNHISAVDLGAFAPPLWIPIEAKFVVIVELAVEIVYQMRIVVKNNVDQILIAVHVSFELVVKREK